MYAFDYINYLFSWKIVMYEYKYSKRKKKK